ncbi:hypothetical protein NMG60_11005490 [Bertholletia excelsa]
MSYVKIGGAVVADALVSYPSRNHRNREALGSSIDTPINCVNFDFAAMDYEAEFADYTPPSFDRPENVIRSPEVKGFNPGLIVLLLVGGLLITFLVGNYLLYMYAHKTLPPKKKKPVSKKKMKRERLKQGVSAPGE